jgi:hypothetical protein
LKINDARSRIMFQRGKAEAKEKLEKDIKETKKKLEDAKDAEQKKLEKKLERLKLTPDTARAAAASGSGRNRLYPAPR